MAPRWVLLIHQIPPKPDYFRVKVWRRLQRLGAVAIKNSVYALPRSDGAVEDFQWQTREIVAGGGEASVCEASFVDGLGDGEIEALFRRARDADYRDLIAEVQQALRVPAAGRGPGRARREGPARLETELERLRRRLADIVAIDFFGAPRRQAAHAALARLEARLRSDAPAAARAKSAPKPRGATWVTRRGVHVDRVASAWLIRRFVDPGARFKFVPPDGYRPRTGEIRFDMFQAEYTHEGGRCTFETLADRFGVADPAVRMLGEIVHDLDCKESRYGRPETAGVERLIAGITRRHAPDAARIEAGLAAFDALHAGLAAAVDAPGAAGPEPPRPARRARSARQ